MSPLRRTRIRLRSRVAAVLLATVASLIVGTPTPSAHAAVVAPAPVGWISTLSTTSATLRWSSVAGATSYDVLRDGRRVAVLHSTTLKLIGLTPATWYGMRVRAHVRTRATAPSDLVPVVTPAASACTRYAAPSGSDSGSGAAPSQPFHTVQHLINSLHAGETGCLAGVFTEDVTMSASGTATAPIVLRSAPGPRATLTGRLQIAKGVSHVVVADLRLDGRAVNGPGAEDLPSPTVNGDDARFLDNDVYNQRTRVCFVIGSIRGWGRAHGTILARNRIHDCGKRDADDNGNNHHHGIYVEGADDTRIVNNVIYQNADRGIQLFPDAQGSTIVGNVLDGNGEGIIFSGGDGFASGHNTVVRNVVTNSRTRNNIEHYWEDPTRIGIKNVAARNCVGDAKEGPFALPIVGYASIGNVSGHPVYANAAAGDFRLTSRSGTASCATWMRSRGMPLAPFSS